MRCTFVYCSCLGIVVKPLPQLISKKTYPARCRGPKPKSYSFSDKLNKPREQAHWTNELQPWPRFEPGTYWLADKHLTNSRPSYICVIHPSFGIHHITSITLHSATYGWCKFQDFAMLSTCTIHLLHIILVHMVMVVEKSECIRPTLEQCHCPPICHKLSLLTSVSCKVHVRKREYQLNICPQFVSYSFQVESPDKILLFTPWIKLALSSPALGIAASGCGTLFLNCLLTYLYIRHV